MRLTVSLPYPLLPRQVFLPSTPEYPSDAKRLEKLSMWPTCLRDVFPPPFIRFGACFCCRPRWNWQSHLFSLTPRAVATESFDLVVGLQSPVLPFLNLMASNLSANKEGSADTERGTETVRRESNHRWPESKDLLPRSSTSALRSSNRLERMEKKCLATPGGAVPAGVGSCNARVWKRRGWHVSLYHAPCRVENGLLVSIRSRPRHQIWRPCPSKEMLANLSLLFCFLFRCSWLKCAQLLFWHSSPSQVRVLTEVLAAFAHLQPDVSWAKAHNV